MSCVSAFFLGQGGEVKVESGQEWESRERERKHFPMARHRGDEGLRLLHGLEANLATSLQTPQEA